MAKIVPCRRLVFWVEDALTRVCMRFFGVDSLVMSRALPFLLELRSFSLWELASLVRDLEL